MEAKVVKAKGKHVGQSIIYLVALFDHDRHMKVIFPKSSFLIHEINVTMLFESSPLQYFLYRMKVQPAVSTIVIVNLSKSASRTKRSREKREKMHFQHKVLCCVLPFLSIHEEQLWSKNDGSSTFSKACLPFLESFFTTIYGWTCMVNHNNGEWRV